MIYIMLHDEKINNTHSLLSAFKNYKQFVSFLDLKGYKDFGYVFSWINLKPEEVSAELKIFRGEALQTVYSNNTDMFIFINRNFLLSSEGCVRNHPISSLCGYSLLSQLEIMEDVFCVTKPNDKYITNMLHDTHDYRNQKIDVLSVPPNNMNGVHYGFVATSHSS